MPGEWPVLCMSVSCDPSFNDPQQTVFPESDSELQVSSAVTAFASNDNTSAIGYQDGTVCIRRSKNSYWDHVVMLYSV